MRAEASWRTEYNISFKVEGLPEESTVTLTVDGEIVNRTGHWRWITGGSTVEFRVEPETETVGWLTYRLEGYVDDEGNRVTPPLRVEKPTAVKAVYARSDAPQGPTPSPPPAMRNLTESTRSFLDVLSKSWNDFLSTNGAASTTYNNTAYPAVWALARAESMYSENLDHPTSAVLTSTIFLALIIGVVYVTPVAVAVACLGTWKLRWKPTFKKMIPPIVLLTVGVILVMLAASFRSPTYTTVGWVGLIITGVATAFLVAIAVSVTASKPITRARQR